MLTSLRPISILILMASSLGSVFAGEMPYTDVLPSAPYASAVQELYDGRIITDDGSRLFRPNELMARDFFVSLAVGIGCKACIVPTSSDIIRYQVSPFIDLPKVNPYYYCIAYAKEYNIAQGYVLDQTGRTSCESGTTYTSSPFCASNTITRIEAAAILLRRAKLWDDTLNSTNFDRTLSIPDATSYWYGYAKKSIEIGIITPKSDGKIGQDEKITRGEFAIMAARILKYTQCKTPQAASNIPLEIVIQDSSGKIVPKVVFAQGSPESLSTISGTGSWDRRWTLTNPTTGEVRTGSGDAYPLSGLSCGNWISQVDLIERSTREIVSTASETITIACTNTTSTVSLAVGITVNPLSTSVGKPVDLSSIVSGGSGSINYRWNYGDGTTSTSSGNTTHIYRDNGSYTVTLTIIDSSGNIAQSSLVIVVSGDRDTDSDGVIDISDQCPLVYAQTPTGCPIISTYTPGITTPGDSLFDKNICLQKKQQAQGLLIGTPNCTQCPCTNTISISSSLRSCDIVFPTILSPTLDTVYSRGDFYLIP